MKPFRSSGARARAAAFAPASIACVAAMLGAGGIASAAEPAAANAPERVLRLRCGSAWDAKSGRIPGPVVIEIRGERIAAVRPASGAPAPDDIDLGTQTCLPGLIDTHTHVLLQGDITADDYDAQLLKQSPEYRTILATVNAKRILHRGFTTIRDIGTEGAGYADVDVKTAIERGVIPGPRMQVAALALNVTGAYPLLGYAPQVTVPKGLQQADGPDGVRRASSSRTERTGSRSTPIAPTASCRPACWTTSRRSRSRSCRPRWTKRTGSGRRSRRMRWRCTACTTRSRRAWTRSSTATTSRTKTCARW